MKLSICLIFSLKRAHYCCLASLYPRKKKLVSLFFLYELTKNLVLKKNIKNRPQVGADAFRGQVEKKTLKKSQGYNKGTVIAYG